MGGMGYGMPRRYKVKYKTPAKVKKQIKKYKKIVTQRNKFRKALIKANGGVGTEGNINQFGATYKTGTDAQKLLRLGTGYRGAGDYNSYSLFNFTARDIGSGNSPSGNTTDIRMPGSYSGVGDYGSMVENQIIHGSGQQPISVNSGSNLSGDVIITHREFLGNVNVTSTGAGSTGFQLASYPINPGLQSSFPWLSQIANNFEMYEFAGLLYEYKPTSGEMGSTGSNVLGKVVMATNYDPDAPVFTSSVQMENYDYAQAAKPSIRMVHGVETAPAQRLTKQLYLRQGEVSKDKVLTDIGLFQVATEGINVGAAGVFNVGELWCTYRVKFSRAQLFGSLQGGSTLQDRFTSVASAASFVGQNTTAIPALPYGNRYQVFNLPSTTSFARRLTNTLQGDCIASVGAPTTTLQYYFPFNVAAGLFRFRLFSSGGAAGVWAWGAPSVLINCVLANPLGYTGAASPNIAAVAATNAAYTEFYIQVTAPGALRAIFNVASTACVNNCVYDIEVTQMPTSLLP